MGMPAAAFWLLGPILAGAGPEQGPAPEKRLVRFEYRRDAHGKPIQDCFILHRPRNRQTCLPSGL